MTTHRHRGGCQVFHFAAFRWCVTQAQELIDADAARTDLRRPPGFLVPEADITGCDQFLPLAPDPPGMLRLIRVDVDTEYAMTTDLTKPLIVAPLRYKGEDLGSIVIDGWHRIYRARREGRTALPVYRLTEDTAEAVSIPLLLTGQHTRQVRTNPLDGTAADRAE